MPENQWKENGVISKGSLLRLRFTLTHKAANSNAKAEVGDYWDVNARSKGAPSFSESPTFTDTTDNPDELTGITHVGKPEGLEAIEVVTRYDVDVAAEMQEHQAAGDIFEVCETYDDPAEDKIYTITTPNCYVTACTKEVGGNDSESSMTMKFQPRGGLRDDMPKYEAIERTQAAQATAEE